MLTSLLRFVAQLLWILCFGESGVLRRSNGGVLLKRKLQASRILFRLMSSCLQLHIIVQNCPSRCHLKCCFRFSVKARDLLDATTDFGTMLSCLMSVWAMTKMWVVVGDLTSV